MSWLISDICVFYEPVQLYRVYLRVSGRPSYSPLPGVNGLHIYSAPSGTVASVSQVAINLGDWFYHLFSFSLLQQTVLVVLLLAYNITNCITIVKLASFQCNDFDVILLDC